MARKGTAVLAVTAVVALLIAGCGSPTPEPTPSPTGFATEDEAFAAAEETYRAYIAALNAHYAGGKSDAKPTDFLVGNALKSALEADRMMQERGLRVKGSMTVVRFTPNETSTIDDAFDVTATVCVDRSASRTYLPDGTDITPERSPIYALDIALTTIQGDDLAIYETEVANEATC